MISVIGIEGVIETLLKFSQIGGQGATATSTSQLRRQFLASAQRLQPNVPRARGTLPCGYSGEKRCTKLIALLNTDVLPQGEEPQVIEHKSDSTDLSGEVLSRMMRQLAALPHHLSVFSMVVDGVICTPSATLVSGTASDAIGAIWCSPRGDWADQDFLEVAVHEMTHTLMFADEFVHLHYLDVDDFLEPDTWVSSAIRDTQRAPDKVLHSIVVGSEILATRLAQGCLGDRPAVHPDTPDLIDKTLASIDAMESSRRLDNILSPRAKALLTLSRQRVNAVRAHRDMAGTRNLSSPREGANHAHS